MKDQRPAYLPVVHLNGNTREQLIEVRANAATALDAALSALRELAPHPRNYPHGDGGYVEALAMFRARFDALENMAKELRAEAFLLCD